MTVRVRRRAWAAVLVLVVVALAGWLGVRGLLARSHLNDARVQLQAARSALVEHRIADAEVAVGKAGRNTRSAHRLTGDVVWRSAGHLPGIGRSFTVSGSLARGADRMVQEALPPAVRAAKRLDAAKLRDADGDFDLATIGGAQPDLASAAAAAGRVQRELAAVPSGGLAPVARARRELVSQIDDVTRALVAARRATAVAPALLGQDRPRRYFVLVQQTSESRGTGGLPGGFVILETRRGHLSVRAQGSNADLPQAEYPPPPGLPKEWVEHYGNLGAFALWVNVNVSPDLPMVARVIASRWQHATGQAIDGVVALDAAALSDVLRGSGPVALPDGRQLAADSIVDYLAIGQYKDFAPPTGSDGIDRSAERKEVLRLISRAATARLVNGGGDTQALLEGLAHAVRSGHLRMTSDDPALAPELTDAGMTGALPAGDAPVAYPVIFNSSGGKLDYFIDRHITYSAGDCTGETRRSHIEVTLTNRAPATGLPPYLTTRITDKGRISSTTDLVTLMVYATRGAVLRNATLDQVRVTSSSETGPVLEQFTEAGLPVWHVLVELPPGAPRRFALDLDEPTAPGAARVPEQPLARPLTRSVDVPTC